MSRKISASIMCANLLNLHKDIIDLVNANVDYLHLDIMDGVFVDNITLGLDLCNSIKEVYEHPVDYHLLMKYPLGHIKKLICTEGDIVGFHFESEVNHVEAASIIHSKGAKASLYLNPSTELTDIENIIQCFDIISLMMTEPGFSGLKMNENSIMKISQTRELLDSLGLRSLEIEVDGNVSFNNAAQMQFAGADIYVAGSSSIFIPDESIVENVKRLRNCLG